MMKGVKAQLLFLGLVRPEAVLVVVTRLPARHSHSTLAFQCTLRALL